MNAGIATALNYQSKVLFTHHVVQLALANSTIPIVSTKFSEQSAVFLHIALQLKPDIPIIWVDTGYNTRATVKFAHEVTLALQLNLHVYKPRSEILTVPPSIDDPAHSAFTHEVKIEPFARAMQELQADTWLSSVKRYQSAHRDSLPVFKQTDNSLLKVSPMLNWSESDVEHYRQFFALPKGPSCYDPTKGEPMRECGLHL